MNDGAITVQYDGVGNRVAKTVVGITTRYLVDDLNPSGFAQAVEELVGSAVQRTYAYGLTLISQNQLMSGNWTPSFYGYDGGSSVRLLADVNGTVTDTYDYDAWGNAVNTTGTTPNNYLYRGEQVDPDLGLYYLRARYFNALTGRLLTRDPEMGEMLDPATLHKYLYAAADPVNRIDPSGRELVDYSLLLAKFIQVIPAVLATAYAINCLLVHEATSIPGAEGMPVPPLYAACRSKIRQCRCSLRDAPPNIMALCPARVYGTGATMHDCQNNAKFTAPQECRRYYGHCGWIQ